jgi:hypothetical protein
MRFRVEGRGEEDVVMKAKGADKEADSKKYEHYASCSLFIFFSLFRNQEKMETLYFVILLFRVVRCYSYAINENCIYFMSFQFQKRNKKIVNVYLKVD